MHWCCIGQEELSKCKEMSTAFRYKRFRPLFTCVDASSTDDCVHKIDQDIADVFTIPNFYLYKHRDKLYPIMAEDYANGTIFCIFLLVDSNEMFLNYIVQTVLHSMNYLTRLCFTFG